jgi:hypothetical protein
MIEIDQRNHDSACDVEYLRNPRETVCATKKPATPEPSRSTTAFEIHDCGRWRNQPGRWHPTATIISQRTCWLGFHRQPFRDEQEPQAPVATKCTALIREQQSVHISELIPNENGYGCKVAAGPQIERAMGGVWITKRVCSLQHDIDGLSDCRERHQLRPGWSSRTANTSSYSRRYLPFVEESEK